MPNWAIFRNCPIGQFLNCPIGQLLPNWAIFIKTNFSLILMNSIDFKKGIGLLKRAKSYCQIWNLRKILSLTHVAKKICMWQKIYIDIWTYTLKAKSHSQLSINTTYFNSCDITLIKSIIINFICLSDCSQTNKRSVPFYRIEIEDLADEKSQF